MMGMKVPKGNTKNNKQGTRREEKAAVRKRLRKNLLTGAGGRGCGSQLKGADSQSTDGACEQAQDHQHWNALNEILLQIRHAAPPTSVILAFIPPFPGI
jgi:hypothetical protein